MSECDKMLEIKKNNCSKIGSLFNERNIIQRIYYYVILKTRIQNTDTTIT